MFSSTFIHREIDAINEKWREIQKGSERKGEALAIFYRLHVHPDLWFGITKHLAKLSLMGCDVGNDIVVACHRCFQPARIGCSLMQIGGGTQKSMEAKMRVKRLLLCGALFLALLAAPASVPAQSLSDMGLLDNGLAAGSE